MLKPERMHHVRLFVKNPDRERLIDLLAEMEAVHLEQFPAHESIAPGESLANAQELSAALTTTKQLLGKIPAGSASHPCEKHTSIPSLIELTENLAHRYAEHEQRISAIEKEQGILEEKRSVLSRITGFKSPIETLFEAKSVSPILIDGDPGPCPEAVLVHKGKEATLLIVPRERTEEIRKGLEELPLDPIRGLSGTPEAASHHISRRQAALEHALDAERKAMDSFSDHRPLLEEAAYLLEIELMKAQAPLHFGTTKRLSIVTGYLPSKRTSALREAIGKKRLRAVIEATPATDAPTLLENPSGIRNFEALMHLYTLPRYNEIDPTSLMAITFPLFFGFMLGDMGYGIALLALFAWIHHKYPPSREFSKIIMISAASTIVFGALYGEVFGSEVLFGYHLPHIISRVHDMEAVFAASLLLGAFHVNLGLILGIINESREEGVLFALIKKGGWIVFEIGAVLVAAGYGWLSTFPLLSALQADIFTGWIVLLIGIVGVIYGEGVQGLFELPMVFSHTLSYLRLGAVGMASVYMALIVNQFGVQLASKGVLGILGSIAIVVIGHTINLGLGLLGPFLHSLRLHYAEFFMKFYGGGGKAYRPFGTIDG